MFRAKYRAPKARDAAGGGGEGVRGYALPENFENLGAL